MLEQTALITVMHDPRGKNEQRLRDTLPELERIYQECFIAVSDQTSEAVLDVFDNSSFRTKVIPKSGAANARREALAFGLTGSCDSFHYCDGDRLLTWAGNHLQELKETARVIPDYHYLIIGRTEKAFHSHPASWVETEKITNKVCSLELGKEVDVTAGSCGFSRSAGEMIKRFSKEKMTDSEWPMIVRRIAGLDVSATTVEGLEYQDEVNGTNVQMEEAESWLVRLKLSLIISETACRTGK